MNEMLSAAEAAEFLGVTRLTIQNWLRAGRLRGVKFPGRLGWQVSREEAERARREGLRPAPEASTA